MEPTRQTVQIPLTLGSLLTLMEHLEAVGGVRASEAAFIAAGRECGYASEQGGAVAPRSVRERLDEALAAVRSQGLANAVLREFHVGVPEADGRLVCEFGPAMGAANGEAQRLRHLLAAGYLAGWVASSTGNEVTCDLLRNSAGAGELMCRIRHPSRTPDGGHDPRRGPSPLGTELQGLGIGLADLTELTLDTVIFLDAGGKVRYWNRGASLMFGYESAEVLGRGIEFLFPDDLLDDGELGRLKATCSVEGSVRNHTTRRLRKDGVTVWVSLSRTASVTREGCEIGVIATMRDITAEREREHELERSRSLALVGDLAAKIAHEVKNPLAGIHAALQVIEGDLDPSDPRHEVFDAIAQEVVRLNDITQDLLRFASPPVPKLRRSDLGRFLVDVAGDLERLSMASSGQIDVGGLEQGIEAPFDRLMLGQVFKNLILNGIQAAGGSGTIRLTSRRHHGNVAIDVADTGPGIKSESRASIFEPFFTTKSRGTGLGLSIAKKNVEAHGGTIRLRSHRGRGAIFRVELPLGG